MVWKTYSHQNPFLRCILGLGTRHKGEKCSEQKRPSCDSLALRTPCIKLCEQCVLTAGATACHELWKPSTVLHSNLWNDLVGIKGGFQRPLFGLQLDFSENVLVLAE